MFYQKQLYEIVLFAGGFNSELRLYPLCEKTPRCLLQVANKPLIAYSLEHLEKYNYSHVYIVTNLPNNSKKKIQQYLDNQYKGQIKYEIINIYNEDQHIREIDVLTNEILQQKIQKDFILLNCDTISNINLDNVTDFHNLNNASLTMVLNEDIINEEKMKVLKPSSFSPHDIVLISDKQQVGCIINQEIVEEEESLSVKKCIMANQQNLQIYTNLFDTHIYICKQYILQLIKLIFDQYQPDFESFKEDFLPYLIDFQYNEKLLQEINAKFQNEAQTQPFYKQQKPLSSIVVMAYIQKKNSYSRRLINIKEFVYANCQTYCEEGIAAYFDFTENNGKVVKDKLNLFDDSTTIQGEQQNIQKSIIGRDVKIEEGCTIENSIIIGECTIPAKSEIKNCIFTNKLHISQDKPLQYNNLIIFEKDNQIAQVEII